MRTVSRSKGRPPACVGLPCVACKSQSANGIARASASMPVWRSKGEVPIIQRVYPDYILRSCVSAAPAYVPHRVLQRFEINASNGR